MKQEIDRTPRRGKKRAWVKHVERALADLSHLAVIGGIGFALIQITDYRLKDSAELVLRFSEYLDEEPYLGISQYLDTVDADAKVLQPEGRLAVGEVERYLGTFEMLGELHQSNMITDEMLENNYSYYIEKIFSNKDLVKYIDEARRENPKWWINLARLGKMFGPP